MPAKLSTTISSISSIPNSTNSTLVHEFYEYMKSIGTSVSYQNGNLKVIIYFARFLGVATDFLSIQRKGQIFSFLDTRIKDTEIDPDKRWIRTWNDYLQRIEGNKPSTLFQKTKEKNWQERLINENKA
jgi:hypothetical protein